MKIALVLILSLMTYQALSNSPEYENLSKKLSLLNDVQADFVQHTFDGKGTLLQTQKGTLNLKQPNMFRWESQEPYEQLLVSNGDTLWQFDADLEQVTLQKLNKKLSATPALLLSGDTDQIALEYDIYSEPLQDETHFVLIPKQADVLFDRLRLEFDGKSLLHRMIIKDEVGQKTIIRFLNIQTEQNYPSTKFEFVIPPGIDVIRNQ